MFASLSRREKLEGARDENRCCARPKKNRLDGTPESLALSTVAVQSTL
jgi:hypothetical protein